MTNEDKIILRLVNLNYLNNNANKNEAFLHTLLFAIERGLVDNTGYKEEQFLSLIKSDIEEDQLDITIGIEEN